MQLVETEIRNGAMWLWLNRPGRHNALVPELISNLRTAIVEAAKSAPAALVLCGRGHSFSTGGDVGGFLDHAATREQLIRYANGLVAGLHDTIMDLLTFPAPVLAAVNGPVTGGSTGLVLAADMVAMADTAFVQPYYREVGFGPDGGWTALLPDRVGTARSLEVQYLNSRLTPAQAQGMGLVSRICPRSDLEGVIDDWVASIRGGMAQTHGVTRSNVWDDARLALVRARLEQEKEQFLNLIVRTETLEGMKNFTRKSA